MLFSSPVRSMSLGFSSASAIFGEERVLIFDNFLLRVCDWNQVVSLACLITSTFKFCSFRDDIESREGDF